METKLEEGFPGNRAKVLRKVLPFCGQKPKTLLTCSHPFVLPYVDRKE